MEFLLAHCALQHRVPVPWRDLKPALHQGMDAVLSRYAQAEFSGIEGPMPPMPDGTPFEGFRQSLHSALDSLPGPPFTMQRLAELLIHPEKQYRSLMKLVGFVSERVCFRLLLMLKPYQGIWSRCSPIVKEATLPVPVAKRLLPASHRPPRVPNRPAIPTRRHARWKSW